MDNFSPIAQLIVKPKLKRDINHKKLLCRPIPLALKKASSAPGFKKIIKHMGQSSINTYREFFHVINKIVIKCLFFYITLNGTEAIIHRQ